VSRDENIGMYSLGRTLGFIERADRVFETNTGNGEPPGSFLEDDGFPSLTRLPTGFSPGNRMPASASLMTATGSFRSTSRRSMPRPRSKRMRITAK